MIKKKKFIQIVPFYPLPLSVHKKADYFLIPALVMQKKGFECEYVTLRAQGDKMVETKFSEDQAEVEYVKGFKIIRFESTLKLLNYVRKEATLLQCHLRPFPPSSFAAFLPNPKVIRSFDYVMGSNTLIKLFTYVVLKFFDRILAVTPYEYQIYRRYGVPSRKINLLPLSFDYNFYKKKISATQLKKKYGVKKNDKVIVAVANIRKHKRYDVLLKALALVKKEIPSAKVFVVGDDWLHAQDMPTVKEMADKLDLSGSIVVTGFKTPEVVRQFYSIADVFVHTADNEYQGLVSYEAATAGLPLCLSAIGSHTMVFKENALYHEIEDFKKLAENLIVSIKHRKAREKNIAYLRSYMKNWDYDVLFEQLSDVYDGVLRSKYGEN